VSTATAFDLGRLAAAIEARDAGAQIEQYADDAVVRIVDRISQPRAPRILRGRDEIAAWIEDTCSRDMTHSVSHRVAGASGAAFIVDCSYPNGTSVICAGHLSLEGGRITAQTVVQAWDEEE
jgi:hypothetical protein